MEVLLTPLAYIVTTRMVSLIWVATFSSLMSVSLGQGLYTLDQNDKVGEGIYVASFQVKMIFVEGVLFFFWLERLIRSLSNL